MTEPERRWAEAADLDQEYEEFQLRNGSWVRVRLLASDEVAEMQYLPDLGLYSEMLLTMAGDDADAKNEVDSRELALENIRYQQRVAHIAVFDGTEPSTPEPCSDCIDHRGEPVKHPRSLWALEKCRRLARADLSSIVSIALRSQAVGPLVPFLQDETQPDSTEPADATESTPQTS